MKGFAKAVLTIQDKMIKQIKYLESLPRYTQYNVADIINVLSAYASQLGIALVTTGLYECKK